MILTNQHHIEGRGVSEIIGLVRGNAVRARHIGKDITAFFRNIVGGEVKEYTKLLAETRQQALDRMVTQAKELKADAVISIRFTTSTIASGTSEMLAYGTAVKLK